jgi:putative transposase
MTSDSTTACLPQSEIKTTERLFDNWFDPIEAGLRERARGFLQAMLEAELEDVLARSLRTEAEGRRFGGARC